MGSTVAPAARRSAIFAGRTAEDGLVVAVAVDENARAGEAPADSWGLPRRASPQQPYLPLRRCARLSFGKSSRNSSLEDAGAAWFQKDEWKPGLDLRAMRSRTFGQVGAGRSQRPKS